MTSIEAAKRAWERVNHRWRGAQERHLAKPTASSRAALIAAANRWQKAASAWSAAVVADGNQEEHRAEFAKAMAIKLPGGRRAAQRR